MNIQLFKRLSITSLITLVLISTAMGHHSFAQFDPAKTNVLTGTVRAFEFNYPHTWIWINVPGDAEPWGFENASPVELNRISGWTRASLKVGDKISVKYCGLKSGKHGGAFINVTLPDGRVLTGQAFHCQKK